MKRLLALALLSACAPHHGTPRHIVALPSTTTTSSTASTTTTTPPLSPSTVRSSRATRTRHPRTQVAGRVASSDTVESTAYCLTGTMANGRPAHYGAVAMNGVPFGTRYRVLDGPMAGAELVVSDRYGHSTGFDIAMPGDCPAAIAYGRRSIRIEAA